MEKAQITALLNSGCKTLNKVIKADCLPADLEAEVCNLRYDMLVMLCNIEENATKELIKVTSDCLSSST